MDQNALISEKDKSTTASFTIKYVSPCDIRYLMRPCNIGKHFLLSKIQFAIRAPKEEKIIYIRSSENYKVFVDHYLEIMLRHPPPDFRWVFVKEMSLTFCLGGMW